jgi:hypothetical protein
MPNGQAKITSPFEHQERPYYGVRRQRRRFDGSKASVRRGMAPAKKSGGMAAALKKGPHFQA